MLWNVNIEVVQAWIHIHISGEPGNEATATGIVNQAMLVPRSLHSAWDLGTRLHCLCTRCKCDQLSLVVFD